MAKDQEAGAPSLSLTPTSWYADGLRFECLPDCGACCTNHGDNDQVYLEGDDLQRLADLLCLSPEEFTRRHTTTDAGLVVLRNDSPDCPFLEGHRCGVYAARPKQCRTFPFWPETLASPRAWRRLRHFCPGIDRGPLHSADAIRERLAEHEPGT